MGGRVIASARAAIAWTERLATLWRLQTDSFGTNSHFCLHVVAFADALVRGVTGT